MGGGNVIINSDNQKYYTRSGHELAVKEQYDDLKSGGFFMLFGELYERLLMIAKHASEADFRIYDKRVSHDFGPIETEKLYVMAFDPLREMKDHGVVPLEMIGMIKHTPQSAGSITYYIQEKLNGNDALTPQFSPPGVGSYVHTDSVYPNLTIDDRMRVPPVELRNAFPGFVHPQGPRGLEVDGAFPVDTIGIDIMKFPTSDQLYDQISKYIHDNISLTYAAKRPRLLPRSTPVLLIHLYYNAPVGVNLDALRNTQPEHFRMCTITRDRRKRDALTFMTSRDTPAQVAQEILRNTASTNYIIHHGYMTVLSELTKASVEQEYPDATLPH